MPRRTSVLAMSSFGWTGRCQPPPKPCREVRASCRLQLAAVDSYTGHIQIIGGWKGGGRMSAAGLFGAFLAGLLSFFSPCVLPLTPIYVGQLVGPGVWRTERAGENGSRLRRATLLHAAAFVGGFSLVFIALGATASVLGSFLAGHAALLRQIAGVALVVFGLYVAGIIRI